MSLGQILEAVLVVAVVLGVIIIGTVLCDLAIRTMNRNRQNDDEPRQTLDQKAMSEAISKDIKALVSRIAYKTNSNTYDELPLEEAFRHARGVTDAVVAIYNRCSDAGEVYSDEFQPWLDEDIEVMFCVLAGLFRWGDRLRINDIIIERLEERGVRPEFLEDAYDTSSATGRAPEQTGDQVDPHYYPST